MPSTSRIACVRIPRFPIGVVWHHATASASAPLPTPPAPDEQLLLPMAWEGPSPNANGGVQNRSSGGMPSSSTRSTHGPPAPRAADGHAHWDTRPIVLVDGQRVRTATAAAGRARIRAGMTIAEARSRCATLQVLPWDEDLIARAVTRATAAFVRASPQVTPATGAPGLWWVGAQGMDASGGEQVLGRQLASIARIWHPAARVAIADSCVAARAGTWETPHRATTHKRHEAGAAPAIVIVPPGTCASYLAPAPLGLLTIDDDLRDSLHALGLHTIGDLARLPAEDVERRWGEVGIGAWRLAHGIDARRPGLTRLEAPRSVSTDLSASVETMEPVLFLVRAALDRLLTGLLADGRAAATLAITLVLDDARGPLPTGQPHTVTREVHLSQPLARAIPLLERCRALLDDWPLTAPVAGVRVAITATAPLTGAQGDLLAPAWRDPAAADAAFARLRATLGSDAIVRPVARDSHRPEHAAVWERVEDTRPATDPGTRLPRLAAPVATFRQLDPPEPATVETTDELQATPRAIRWRDRWVRIRRATGPERLGGDWWQDTWERDYWRVEDADHGPDLVLYQDRATAQGSMAWFVHGWYD